MKEIRDYAHFQEVLGEENFFLLYASMPLCSVCASDFPRVKDLVDRMDFPAYRADLSLLPQVAGQLSLMTAPAVLLFFRAREWHRQARIIDFSDLEKRMGEIAEIDQGLEDYD